MKPKNTTKPFIAYAIGQQKVYVSAVARKMWPHVFLYFDESPYWTKAEAGTWRLCTPTKSKFYLNSVTGIIADLGFSYYNEYKGKNDKWMYFHLIAHKGDFK